MKTLLEKVWKEPAAFVSALLVALTLLQAALPVTGTAHALITAALIALGGGTIRSAVTPAARPARGDHGYAGVELLLVLLLIVLLFGGALGPHSILLLAVVVLVVLLIV